jgi:beta-glucosidase
VNINQLRRGVLAPSAAIVFLAVASVVLEQRPLHALADSQPADRPWMDKTLSPDRRADLVLKELTLDEKIGFVHGNGMPGWEPPKPNAYLGNGGAGFVLGVPRLGIPMIQMSDAAYGALIGRELRAQGYNMTLGGGVNLTREPRNGRTFEYMGEDPILAGTLVGNRMKCEQAQHVMGDIKHYALNDQESGRNEVNVIIGKRAMRESDLLAFQIGIEIADPAGVMCSYNAVNGDYACENKYLLTDVLKKDWNFKGFVLSDWGGTHSTVKASAAGLDHEEPMDDFLGEKLKQLVQSGKVSTSELDDHVHRILRAEFASGIVDDPVKKSVVDVESGFETSRHIAEQSIVLLKNDQSILPLDRSRLHSIAVIGPNANTGMISGGGSAQVDPPGHPATKWKEHVWFPTSPLKAIRAKAPGVTVEYDSGEDRASSAALAKKSDVAVVFVYQWTSEDMDLPSLALPDNQDALIEQVAAANPRTIVVLETGTAATMPWLNQVGGVLEAWYAGSKGADAVANILFGDVNPSAKLPMTFPRSEADLPHPQLVTPPPGAKGHAAVTETGEAKPTFEVHYDEGLKVGYRWYDAENKPVLFPFGYGLSYTTFSYSGLKVSPGSETTVSFTIKNTGSRAGEEVAEVYAALPASTGEPPKRLVGWDKVHLNPGENKEVSVPVKSFYLSIYDEPSGSWKLIPGGYTFMVGGSSQNLPLVEKVNLK